jgi:hypothetical protein
MWLMTTNGVLSAVEHRDDCDAVVVRARVREDAEHLAAAVGGKVIETPAADYRFRVRVAKTEWVAYIAGCASAIDYDNFKNAVAARQGPARASVYGEVWATLLRLQRKS